MAFFSKPPGKKPESVKSDKAQSGSQGAAGRGVSARELAAQVASKTGRKPSAPADPGPTVTKGLGPITAAWTPAQTSFEVVQANPGLCAVLENAALRFASGQAREAQEMLEHGIDSDSDTKASPLAWLALFDLLQRAGDKAPFDALSLKYIVQFESSAPAWEAGKGKPQAAPRSLGGFAQVGGQLTAASAPQLESLRRAIAKNVQSARVDLTNVVGFDDVGARLLATALGEARRAAMDLQLQLGDRLQPALDAALKSGREAGEGAWLLSLELLQWANDLEGFEDRAVEFAVTFELSPPSWEPPAAHSRAADDGAKRPEGGAADVDPDMLKWSGVMAGALDKQLSRLADSAHGKAVLPVDMSDVERIDFVCAGALLNSISRIEAQQTAVQIVGASPIIRALLLLIGVSPRQFVKK
jgi:anti-anti-sigma regulatory factor